MRATNPLLAAVLGLGLLSSACDGDRAESSRLTAEFACAREDVPGDFLLLVAGNFTGENLAELSAQRQHREQLLRDARFVAGSFSYWKETVERTPFDPPANILCEALQFEGAEGAATYVQTLDPWRDGDLPGLTWLPEGPRHIEEIPASPGARAFRVNAGTGASGVHLVTLYSARGEYVLAVSVGGASSKNELEQARAIEARLLQRVANLRSPVGR